MKVENDDIAACLLSDSNVTLTCDIVGYSRPEIVFSRASIEIVPGIANRISNISFDQVCMLEYAGMQCIPDDSINNCHIFKLIFHLSSIVSMWG